MNKVAQRTTKKRWNSKVQCLVLLTLVFSVLISSIARAPPPEPYNVKGRVFTNSSNGVQNGIPVLINDTTNGNSVLTYTSAPDVPALRGSYSATIEGNLNDVIVVVSWNSTHYGENTSILDATTINIDVVLNTTRSSEPNVTIISQLSNNSVINKSLIFNVTANITMMGNGGIDCNATVGFSNNTVLNVPDGNFTHALGNIDIGSFVVTSWGVKGINEGSSNITVTAACGSDKRYFENLNTKAISNVTITNAEPVISAIALDPEINLAAGSTITVACNASINDGNSASDIKRVNATFYHESIAQSAPDDNNNHYTNSSCVNISSSAFEVNYTCGFKTAYYADSGRWRCNITVEDYSMASDFRNASAYVNELLAIDVQPAVIDYGSVRASNTSNEVNITIRNAGNIPLNTTVRGFAPNESLAYLNLSMVCPIGNISNANQRFSVRAGTAFGEMGRLNNETQVIENLTLPQRTNDIRYGNDTNSTFWRLEVPVLTLGVCTGTVVFGAIPVN
jgi:hypothetical protein